MSARAWLLPVAAVAFAWWLERRAAPHGSIQLTVDDDDDATPPASASVPYKTSPFNYEKGDK